MKIFDYDLIMADRRRHRHHDPKTEKNGVYLIFFCGGLQACDPFRAATVGRSLGGRTT